MFRTGDVVYCVHRQTPPMTVVEIGEPYQEHDPLSCEKKVQYPVKCHWFESDRLVEGFFRASELVHFQADEPYLMQFFGYAHLPKDKQRISAPFGELAKAMVRELPDNPEREEMLRKLLEAKDCAVRASLAKEPK